MENSTFELPPVKGIEGVMAEVKAWGLKTCRERLIGVRGTGERVFDVLGEEDRVDLPQEWIGKGQGVWLVHCHPSIPTELSIPDFECVVSLEAAGNVAVACDDETVSWSRGPNLAKATSWAFESGTSLDRLFTNLALRAWDERATSILRTYCFDVWGKEKCLRFDETSEVFNKEFVVMAHEGNKLLLRKGMLKDYHVRLGNRAKGLLQLV